MVVLLLAVWGSPPREVSGTFNFSVDSKERRHVRIASQSSVKAVLNASSAESESMDAKASSPMTPS